MRPPDSRPQMDAIMMIAPPPRRFMCGTASREARMAGNSVSANAPPPPRGLHVGNAQPRGANGREQLFVECRLPLGIARIQQIGAGGTSDVVDEDVEAAEPFHRPTPTTGDAL